MNSTNGVSKQAWTAYCEMIDNLFGDIFEKKFADLTAKTPEQWLAAIVPERQAVLDQVLNRCEKADTGCWEWQGARAGGNGYGRIKIGGKLHSPHRAVAWAMDMVNELSDPDRLACVLHRCDNPKCCTLSICLSALRPRTCLIAPRRVAWERRRKSETVNDVRLN